MICTAEEQGVASPTPNNETGTIRLMRNDTGILTPKAPTIPCTITNNVFPQPLKYPIIQNITETNRQSMAYAFKYSAEAAITSASLAKIPDRISPWKNAP